VNGSGPAYTLYEGMMASRLTYKELWLLQLQIGGSLEQIEVEAYVLGMLLPDSYHHDLIAQALNEDFTEQGLNHPVAYSDTPHWSS
jgi:hypothetical protein